MAMTQEFKDNWIKKLTDGTYEREVGNLIYEDNPQLRCCLGVALKVAEEMNLLSAVSPEDAYRRDEQLLDHQELAVIGLTGAEQNALAAANDQHQVPEGAFYPQEVLELIKALPVRTD